ncbi:MAG TPA: zinc metallopeptidase [Planctomycetes bacterium]|nr:zinc metallopeptidase [Planctomycetota bacterium]
MGILTGLYIISGFLIVPLVICGLYARIKVRHLYEKYSKEPVKKGITGSRLARTMLNSAGLNEVVIEEIGGNLRDHYDPRHKAVRLSRRVARNSSIAATGIAAHEAAHAIQDGLDYPPAKFRNNIAPIVEKAGYFILPLLLLGILLSRVALASFFIHIALLLFLAIVVFYLVTLPVELEASARALKFIKENNVVDAKELEGVKKVLKAAVLTYVVATALAIVQFLSLLGINRRR